LSFGTISYTSDVCSKSHYNLPAETSEGTFAILTASPFVLHDSNGDGTEELHLAPGTPCAGIVSGAFPALAAQTTNTTGCRDAAPYDPGAHYPTSSTTDCAP
jgi:hypothetical protein